MLAATTANWPTKSKQNIVFRWMRALCDLWAQMTRVDPFNLQTVLPPPINTGVPLPLIIHDYTVIRWWSNAMSVATRNVGDMRAFLAANGGDAEALKDDPEFKKKGTDLADALAESVRRSQPDFLDARGVAAMYTASRRLATVRGSFSLPARYSSKTDLQCVRQVPPAQCEPSMLTRAKGMPRSFHPDS
jgi:hypothetical protein